MLSFGQRLKMLRKEAQLTQAELADKLMISVQAVSKWECDNTMPDISQIVPLSAILGVTTDCLLGVGGDEKADRERLYSEVKVINKGIEKVYSRKDNAYYESYELYREHIRKYPLDYEVKLLCADSIVRYLYYGAGDKEEKERLYNEALSLLKSVISYDKDITRVIDSKQTLIILYLYNNDFNNAEAVAEGLPSGGNIRANMELEIYSKKNDNNKCLEISNRMCNEAIHLYLKALAIKAKRMSIYGNERKCETIDCWKELIDNAKYAYKKTGDIRINTKWLYSGMNNLSNEYISMSDNNKALDVIEELTDALVLDYKDCRSRGDAVAKEIKDNFKFYLHNCYNRCFPTEDNIIARDPRFKKCEEILLVED